MTKYVDRLKDKLNTMKNTSDIHYCYSSYYSLVNVLACDNCQCLVDDGEFRFCAYDRSCMSYDLR